MFVLVKIFSEIAQTSYYDFKERNNKKSLLKIYNAELNNYLNKSGRKKKYFSILLKDDWDIEILTKSTYKDYNLLNIFKKDDKKSINKIMKMNKERKKRNEDYEKLYLNLKDKHKKLYNKYYQYINKEKCKKLQHKYYKKHKNEITYCDKCKKYITYHNLKPHSRTKKHNLNI